MTPQTGNAPANTRMTGRRLAITAVFAVAALVALVLGLLAGTGRLGDGNDASGESLFAVSLPDGEGREQSLAQWRGKVLVVNFWATWCAPCRDEMPQFVHAQDEFGQRGLQFVGIAVDEPAKVRQFAREIGLNYPALIGGFGAMELSKVYGNRLMALPFTLVVDRSGRIVHTQLGPLAPTKLQSIVKGLL